MKTTTNMAKTMLMSILTAGTVFGFTSCSDELNQLGENIINDNNSLMNLEQYSYEVPVKVNCTGKWQAEIKFADEDNMFCYLTETEGQGPATIKLGLLDNWTDQRNAADLIITDLDNPANTQTMHIGQKCNTDNEKFMTRSGEDAVVYVYNTHTGRRANVVGYGFNVARMTGDEAISMQPIIEMASFEKAGGNAVPSPLTIRCRITTYCGSTTEAVTEKMTADCTLKGSYAGFKSEVGASFSREVTNSTTYNYALGVADVALRSITLQEPSNVEMDQFLTANFVKALNGNGQVDKEQFKALLDKYGTHLIIKANMGGRLRYATAVKKSLMKSVDDMKTWANANYKNKIVEGDAKVNASLVKNYQTNNDNGSTTVTVEGGTVAAASALIGPGKDTDENVSAWIASMNDIKDMALVNPTKDGMIPVWEFMKPENKARAEALRDYVESGDYGLDCSDDADEDARKVTHFTIPKFTDDPTATLVKDVYVDGMVVARVCNEYIPALDNTQRVTVVYPIIGGKANYERGFFIGTAKKEPRYVKWNTDGTVTFETIKGMQKGAMKEVYMRGTNFYTQSLNAAFLMKSDNVKGKVMDKMLQDNWWTGKQLEQHNYPLVKIANKVWSREEYSGKQLTEHTMRSQYVCYYTDCQAANAKNFPLGWKVAASQDFEAAKKLLSANNNLTPQNELFGNGKTGFNAMARGKYRWSCHPGHKNVTQKHADYFTSKSGKNECFFMCSDMKYCYIAEGEDFKTGVKSTNMWEEGVGSNWYTETNAFYAMVIRLVEE